MTTSRDVARVAGVSQATVSRVTRGDPSVREETRRRVLAAVNELGFSPNGMARAMRRSRAGTIGIVVESLSNVFYPEVLDALAVACTDRDLRMMVWIGSGAGEAAAVDAVRSHLVDGLILTTATPDTVVLQEALRQRAPIVLVNRTVKEIDADQVAVDNRRGTRLVAAYFADHGRQKVGLIGGPRLASTASEREAEFRRLVKVPAAWYQRSGFSYSDGRDAARAMLLGDSCPDTIFCVGDMLAFGVLDAAREIGVKVPDELWVVGFNDVELANWPAFDLTTVRQPIDLLIGQALELLQRRIRDPGIGAERRLLPPELRVRGSTGHAGPGLATLKVDRRRVKGKG